MCPFNCFSGLSLLLNGTLRFGLYMILNCTQYPKTLTHLHAHATQTSPMQKTEVRPTILKRQTTDGKKVKFLYALLTERKL